VIREETRRRPRDFREGRDGRIGVGDDLANHRHDAAALGTLQNASRGSII